MNDWLQQTANFLWPMVIAIAWPVGEIGHRLTGLPRISLYALVGFVLGQTPLGRLSADASRGGMVMANIAFGLILFEFGYRIHLRWLRTNPWLGITGVVEALATWGAVGLFTHALGASALTALLLGALSMSTYPATVMRVVNEERSAGQVTERLLHLAALNSALAVVSFHAIVGFWAFEQVGSLWLAITSSAGALLVSAGLGALFGLYVPVLLRLTAGPRENATIACAIAVVLLVMVTHALALSPMLAALTFGVMTRWRRRSLAPIERQFGALGHVLAVVLFTYIAMTLAWPRVLSGLKLALVLVLVRALVKVLCVTLLARASGTTWRKGALTGLGLAPIATAVILMLEQTRHLGPGLLDQLAPLAAATLLLELLGPMATQLALRLAGESHDPQERARAAGTV